MKQVAGMIRLDLAQYREKQAFAQFGSDLDAATRAQLARGDRIMEILKQDQYKPIPVELQVVSIFAVNNGFCDKLAVPQVRDFEKELHAFMTANYSELLAKLREKEGINEAVEKELKAAIGRCVEMFAPAAHDAGMAAEGGAETPAADAAAAV